MTRIWVKRSGSGLFVYERIGEEDIQKLPLDTPLKAEITQPRNYKRLQLHHCLLHIVAKGIGIDKETVEKDIKKALGYYVEVTRPNGAVVPVFKSVSYSAMPDEAAFIEFFEREIQAVYHLYGILPDDARRQIDEMLAPKTEVRR